MKKIFVAPSILSADFMDLASEIKSVESADYLHLDLMDGHFVPNLTFGPPVLKNIDTSLKLDWHLMTENPENYFAEIAKIGGEFITVHLEACRHLHRTLEKIRDLGFKPGVSINPATPIALLKDILAELDLVLIMSVNPGFGGQSFIKNSLKKIEELRSLDGEILIEVDGGINEETATECVKAGADILVAGSYIFKAENRAEVISKLKLLTEK